ncbi:hypothetical protein [Bacillus sp. TL12]|uniref:hypothetical protein n=1 Tax=Bacillus sp. TL12 TaxID=2894756 RepID=UPI001F52144E|nr:hypothetical protein [Bacillus sp. TL12]MCI0767393.1 hypothetical protein [Bacillus sp. TL12]
MNEQIKNLNAAIEELIERVNMLDQKINKKVSKTEILSDLEQALKLKSGRNN